MSKFIAALIAAALAFALPASASAGHRHHGHHAAAKHKHHAKHHHARAAEVEEEAWGEDLEYGPATGRTDAEEEQRADIDALEAEVQAWIAAGSPLGDPSEEPNESEWPEE